MSENPELWEIATRFRNWVTAELGHIATTERQGLRGDYLFRIDEVPRFVVMVEPHGAWSGEITRQPQLAVHLSDDCPIRYTDATLKSLIDSGAARTTIATDSNTLLRLLTGSMRASSSFVSGRVKINGDLAAFMRLVSHLKRQGVGPLKGIVETVSR